MTCSWRLGWRNYIQTEQQSFDNYLSLKIASASTLFAAPSPSPSDLLTVNGDSGVETDGRAVTLSWRWTVKVAFPLMLWVWTISQTRNGDVTTWRKEPLPRGKGPCVFRIESANPASGYTKSVLFTCCSSRLLSCFLRRCSCCCWCCKLCCCCGRRNQSRQNYRLQQTNVLLIDWHSSFTSSVRTFQQEG